MWVNAYKRLLNKGASPCRKVCCCNRKKKKHTSVSRTSVDSTFCVSVCGVTSHIFISLHTLVPLRTLFVCLCPSCRLGLCVGASSPSSELLDKQRGVCQHAGHIMLLLCSSTAKRWCFCVSINVACMYLRLFFFFLLCYINDTFKQAWQITLCCCFHNITLALVLLRRSRETE